MMVEFSDHSLEINGKKITWFKDFLETNTNKIGIRFSGGSDSTLLLWMLCHFCYKAKKYDMEIYPFYLRDWWKKVPSKGNKLKKILNLIQQEFPKLDIKPLDLTIFYSYSVPHIPLKDSKTIIDGIQVLRLEPSCEKKEIELRQKYGIEWFINGRNLNLTKEEILQIGLTEKDYQIRDVRRDADKILEYTYDRDDLFEPCDTIKTMPFYNITKIDVKDLYEGYNLLEKYFSLTDSCTSNKFPFPCKECFWCKERRAIFGMYDGGIQ